LRVIGLTNDIIIDLSEISPENKSLVSIIVNNGRNSEDIKFKTKAGIVALFIRGPPSFLVLIRLTDEANRDINTEIKNNTTNFLFENILKVSVFVLVNRVCIFYFPP